MENYRSTGSSGGTGLPGSSGQNNNSSRDLDDHLSRRIALEQQNSSFPFSEQRSQGGFQDNQDSNWSPQQMPSGISSLSSGNQGLTGLSANLGRMGTQGQNSLVFPSGVTPQILMANNQQQLQMMSSVQQLQMMNNAQQLQMMNGIIPLNIAGLQMPFSNGTMPLLNITSKAPKKTKKRRKKPKDRPKRPLSAYNLFFKDERGNILSSIPGEGDDEDDSSPPRKNITWPGKKRPPHGKISFESLAKTIGGRWKSLSEDRLTHYKKKAEEDLERYAKEMIAYEKKLTMKQELSKGKSSGSSEDDEDEEEEHKTKDTKVIQTKRKRDPIRATSSSGAADPDRNEETNSKKPKLENQSPNNQDMMNMSNLGMAGMGMGVYFLPTGDNQTNLNALGLMGNNALTNASEQSNENGASNQRQFGQMMSSMNSDLQGYEQELMQQRRHLQHQQDLLSNFNDLENEGNNSNFSAHRDLQQDYSQAQMYNSHQQAFMNANNSNNNNEGDINGGEEYRMGMNQFPSEFNKD